MPDHLFFRGGVHPEEGKALTSGKPVREAPLLETYVVPLQQHIGAPARAVVKKKDPVLRGTVLGEAGGFVSAPVHSPTSGTVADVTDCIGPQGTRVPCVLVEADGDDTPCEPMPVLADWESLDRTPLLARIAEAGIVGMGGAAFPTAVKLSPPPAKTIDTLIINGAECEPFLTADHRVMLEQTAKVLVGARIMARVLGVNAVRIGVEANKPDAIGALTAAAAGTDIRVIPMRVRYPQGAEKQLIFALTGRKVPTGGLPMDVGCVVQNAGTAVAVAEAVLEGKPLYERVTTITGTPVVEPGNWRLRVGTTLARALSLAGGTQSPTGKMIFGGPMMGQSVYSLDVPVMKNTSGILLLAPEAVSQYTSGPCIRCGRCVDACPMALMPGALSVYCENERFDLAEERNAQDCIECGCCSYVCPSARPIVQHLRRAKGEIVARRRAAQAKKGA